MNEAISADAREEIAQSVLVRLAGTLAGWESLDDLLSALMRLVLEVGGHDRVSVFLWDEDAHIAKAVASAGVDPLPVNEEFEYDGLSHGLRSAIDARRTTVIDYDTMPPSETRTADRLGSRLALFAPMQRRGRLVGAIMVDDPGVRREFDRRHIETIESIASHGATGVQNAGLLRQLEESLDALTEKDRAIRQAYSDVIDAVTGGRLVIVGRDELDTTLIGESQEEIEISRPEQVSVARRRLSEMIGDIPAFDDLQVAFCEGLTNMLKHAGGGEWWVLRDAERVQLVLSDSGPGIDFAHLPKATLVPGYSLAQSLGMGFTLMMELADRVLVCTDPGGTTLVLEKDLPGSGSEAEQIDNVIGRRDPDAD